jgi:indole-3-glycerol phosphate synthase
LLIVRLTPDLALLTDLIGEALSFNLTPVVEVFAPADLELARAAQAKVVQVNARDLETLALDPGAHLKLIASDPPLADEFWIAASGLATAQDLVARRAAGFGAVLIGSALMGQSDPKRALNNLLVALA